MKSCVWGRDKSIPGISAPQLSIEHHSRKQSSSSPAIQCKTGFTFLSLLLEWLGFQRCSTEHFECSCNYSPNKTLVESHGTGTEASKQTVSRTHSSRPMPWATWEWLDRWARRNKHVCKESLQQPSHTINSICTDFPGLQSICMCQNPYLVSPVNSCTSVGCCEKNIWYVVFSLLCFATSTHEIHLLFRKNTQWHQSWVQDDDRFCFFISKYWSYQHTNSGPSDF